MPGVLPRLATDLLVYLIKVGGEIDRENAAVIAANAAAVVSAQLRNFLIISTTSTASAITDLSGVIRLLLFVRRSAS